MLTRRNMFVPISVLPVEILVHIFHLNAVVAASARTYSPTLSPGLVSVMHVCRHWRQVALNDSTLWTEFSTSPRDEDWISERLSRARNAPLIIELGASVDRDMVFLFTPHISHTRELYLRNIPSITHSVIMQEVSTQKASELECFELRVSSTLPIMHPAGHSFFNGPLPKLRVLCLSQILFPWSLVPRGPLTQLRVALNEEDFTSHPEVSPHEDLNQLIDLLVNCPALEVLHLENCLPVTLSESSGEQTIHLPRLSRLFLAGSSSRVRNLLKMLKLSSSTTLCLICTPEYVAPENASLILSILSVHFNHPIPTKFRSFQIHLDHMNRTIDMFASTSLPRSSTPHAHVIQGDTDIGAQLRLSLSFLSVHDFNNIVDMISTHAREVLPLSKLDTLSISSPARAPRVH